MIAQHGAAGLEVAFDASGTPHTLGGAADHSTYRILQEALTNAARHGAGGAQIQIAFGETAVELTITNPVPARGAPPSRWSWA